MKNIYSAFWLLAGMTLTLAPAANAQVASPATEKFYVNVNVGGQLAERTIDFQGEPRTIYDEPATFASSVPVSRGVMFDGGAGYRVWEDVYVGVVVSSFRDTSVGSWTASIPHPVLFNRPLARAGDDPTDLKRRETAVSPNVTWVRPLTDKIDVTLGIGLSIISAKQDLVASYTVPPATQNVITSVTATEGTGSGVYAAVDFIYNLAARYGVGGFLRYAGAKVDLADSNDNVLVKDHNVGGLQAGVGIRLRF